MLGALRRYYENCRRKESPENWASARTVASQEALVPAPANPIADERTWKEDLPKEKLWWESDLIEK